MMNAKTNSFKQSLASRTKGIEDVHGILAKIYRKVLIDIDLRMERFEYLMQKYDRELSLDNTMTRRAISSEKSNILREMGKPTMSWKVFKKCIGFLRPTNIKFAVELTWANGKTTHTSLKIPMSDMDFDEDDVDDLAELVDAEPITEEERMQANLKLKQLETKT